jgi:tellurium resistance protein TerD
MSIGHFLNYRHQNGRRTIVVNLAKGGSVDLTKEAGGALTCVRVGLGWDASETGEADCDLDASVIGCDANSVSVGEDWFVFYNRLRSPDDAIVHQGDELTGDSEGDDEQIVVDLTKLPASIAELAIAVTIHKAVERGQDFSKIKNAYVRISDEANGTDLARYELTRDGSHWNSLVFGKLYRDGGAWKFKALGDEGSTTELQGIVDTFKIA